MKLIKLFASREECNAENFFPENPNEYEDFIHIQKWDSYVYLSQLCVLTDI